MMNHQKIRSHTSLPSLTLVNCSSFKIETCNTSCSGSCHYEEWICLQGLDIVVLSRFPLSHLLVLLLPVSWIYFLPVLWARLCQTLTILRSSPALLWLCFPKSQLLQTWFSLKTTLFSRKVMFHRKIIILKMLIDALKEK